ncbi:MAG: glutamine amidotransferase [Deltaproteobacteria bacterium]|nr:glutamine amidotransferase [Deltaproteobacteria bacterium]
MTGPLLILQAGNIPRRYGLRDSFGDMFVKHADLQPGSFWVTDVSRSPRFPKDPRDYCGYIVTGSLSMVTARPVWSLKLTDFLLRVAEKRVPLLGVCYGHQIVARALGGRVGWNPAGLEMGTHEVTLAPGAETHPLLCGLPGSFPANLCHAQSVLAPPSGARILASSSHDPCQIMSWGEKVLTVQFHPEFDRWTMNAFARTCYDMRGGRVELRPRRTPAGVPGGISLGLPVSKTPVPVLILRRFAESALRRRNNPLAPAGFAG